MTEGKNPVPLASLGGEKDAKTLILRLCEENIDRENVVSYLPDPLKPGRWLMRALRPTEGMDPLCSPWKSFAITAWQTKLPGLRFNHRPKFSIWKRFILESTAFYRFALNKQ